MKKIINSFELKKLADQDFKIATYTIINNLRTSLFLFLKTKLIHRIPAN